LVLFHFALSASQASYVFSYSCWCRDEIECTLCAC
jgi:hypothetical protein